MSNKATKFHPILFSTPMVQAILEGKKTQTRRAVKLPNYHPSLVEKQKKLMTIKDWILYDGNNENIGTIKANYNVGDVLWVRETFIPKYFNDGKPLYRAEDNNIVDACRNIGEDLGEKWQPSIHMPKEICRIFLKVKSVKIERLNDISEEDAKKEGVLRSIDTNFPKEELYYFYPCKDLRDDSYINKGAKVSFSSLWASIYGWISWRFNPYVFVYEYETIEKPLNFI